VFRARTARDGPLVSIVLATRDRPRLLPIALACFERQTYPQRELIVVDDGVQAPVERAAIAAVGGRLLRAEPGGSLGAKLNQGLSAARGALCAKWDDDDWYAPRYLETLVTRWAASRRDVCRPAIALITPFLFFDLARWEIRLSDPRQVSGATFLFGHDDWQELPFRGLSIDEDLWFLLDQTRAGLSVLPVWEPELYLAVRHGGSGGQDRGHTWTRWSNGGALEEWVREQPLYRRRPEALLPRWAVGRYRELRQELLERSALSV